MSNFPESDPKDPGATLDYKLDLKAKTNGTGTEDYLQTGETVASIVSVISAPSGAGELVVDSYSIVGAGTGIEIWVSGGVAGTRYTITTKFTTSVGTRTDERSFTIKVRDR